MPNLNRVTSKRISYFIAGIILVTVSSLASLAIALTGILCFAHAIAFIAAPFVAFMPFIISTLVTSLFWTWSAVYTLILHHELTRIAVLFSRKKIIKSLRLKKSDFIQIRRIDPFRKVWLWGYLLPILCLFVYTSFDKIPF